MSFAMKVHNYTRETDFYEENIEKLRQIGVTANLFYQGKRFTAVLVEQYPELQQNDIYTPYAVVFYPSICSSLVSNLNSVWKNNLTSIWRNAFGVTERRQGDTKSKRRTQRLLLNLDGS